MIFRPQGNMYFNFVVVRDGSRASCSAPDDGLSIFRYTHLLRRRVPEITVGGTKSLGVPLDEHRRTCIARQFERSRFRGLTELASHHRSKIICLIVDEIVISTRKKPIGRGCAPGL